MLFFLNSREKKKKKKKKKKNKKEKCWTKEEGTSLYISNTSINYGWHLCPSP